MSIGLGIPSVRSSATQTAQALAARAAGAPRSGGLVDTFGRQATDLRISLTDKCNLRCTYCMPAEGMAWMPQSQLLSAAEVHRLVRIAVGHLGMREVRFTGGEPLIRQELEEIIATVRADYPSLPISLTTNGIGLAERAQQLANAGLTRVNISLDTIDASTYALLARRDRLGQVLDGIEAAGQAGLLPIKINAVLMRNVNEGQASELLDFCLRRGLQLRFIEHMPLDAGHGWTKNGMVTAAEIREHLNKHWRLRPVTEPRGGAPAQRWDVFSYSTGAWLGTVGIIASVTEPFCSECTRSRITAEGRIRTCLFSHEEFDLRELLRTDFSDAEVAQAWRYATWLKPAAHGMAAAGLGSEAYVQPQRSMSAIGG